MFRVKQLNRTVGSVCNQARFKEHLMQMIFFNKSISYQEINDLWKVSPNELANVDNIAFPGSSIFCAV